MGKDPRRTVQRVDWKSRALEAEAALEDASKALDLIPIDALETGYTWIPSSVAIALLKRAEDSVNFFIGRHWHTGVRP